MTEDFLSRMAAASRRRLEASKVRCDEANMQLIAEQRPAATPLYLSAQGFDLIEALPDAPGVRVVVAGAGPGRSLLERRARELSVADRVAFLGHVPPVSLPELLKSLDGPFDSSRQVDLDVVEEDLAIVSWIPGACVSLGTHRREVLHPG